MVSITIHANWLLAYFPWSNVVVCAITRGEASSVVNVVLIIVVSAAIAIMINHSFPISEVYNPINWPAKVAPLEEKETPESKHHCCTQHNKTQALKKGLHHIRY